MFLVIVAVIIGALAFGITRLEVYRMRGPDLGRLQDVSFLTGELQLSEAQASELRALHTTLAARLNDCCARHCEARACLVQALTGDTEGGMPAEAAVDEMCRAYEESERATLEHIRTVRALLNAEQKERFDALVTDYMSQTCSMPAAASSRSVR
jgi:hypothetical protein